MTRLSRYLFFVCLVSLLGCSLGEENLFQEYSSPDGRYSLRVTVTEPKIPLGPLYVTVYLLKSSENEGAKKIFHSKLENDGVPFTATNIAVRWMSQKTALVCLRATDLPDHGIYIELDESIQLS